MRCREIRKATLIWLAAIGLFASCDQEPVDADRVHLGTQDGWPHLTIDGYHRYRDPDGSISTYDIQYNFLNQRVSCKYDFEKDDKSKRVTAHFHDVRWRR